MVIDDVAVLGCGVASSGKCFPTFRRTELNSFSNKLFFSFSVTGKADGQYNVSFLYGLPV